MNIIVCMKWIPDTSEADLTVAAGAKDIKKDDLDHDINDWDRFAVEEAVQIKEKVGGKVTVVCVAPEDSEETLRECLARGADEAFQVWSDEMEGGDGYCTASILAKFIKNRDFDLVLTGTLAEDDGAGQVGGMLAAMLDIPSSTLVSKIEINDKKASFWRELEGGLYESIETDIPCLISVATGLNEPRFVSIRAVRKVASIDIPNMGIEELGMDAGQVGQAGARLVMEEVSLPPEGEGAEIIAGKPEESAARLAEILKEKGALG